MTVQHRNFAFSLKIPNYFFVNKMFSIDLIKFLMFKMFI